MVENMHAGAPFVGVLIGSWFGQSKANMADGIAANVGAGATPSSTLEITGK